MSFLKNYDPSRVTVSYMGYDITGFMDGTFIEAERNEDAFTTHTGADGGTARVRNLNKTGKVTLTLMAQAPSNDILMALHAQDEQFGLNYGPLMIKDLNGNMVCRATAAWIMKVPKMERAKEAGSAQWVFECHELRINIGGNVI